MGHDDSNQRENQTTYFWIDAPFYSVDEIRSQTLHLPESDPRDDVLAHHDGCDEFLAVLLGGHAQQSTGWPEREAHQVRVVLLQQDREDRRCTGAQRVSHQGQSELMRAPGRVLAKFNRQKIPFIISCNFYLQKSIIEEVLTVNVKFAF